MNRRVLLNPDEIGISDFIEITSFEDLKEHIDLIQSEEYSIELIVENDFEIDSFLAIYTGEAKGKRIYEVEFALKSREYKVKEVQFEELSSLIQQLINNEKFDLSEWQTIIMSEKDGHDDILTINYFKKLNMKTTLSVVGIMFIAAFIMMLFRFDNIIIGLVSSMILSIIVGFSMFALSIGRLMKMVNQQEIIIGYKIDEVFKNKDFTIGDFYSEKRSRNRDFYIDLAGEVILLRECVDTVSLRNIILSENKEKRVVITLVSGVKIRVKMSPVCAKEIQRWIDM